VGVLTGKDGEPWFVAADVCEALTISNNRDALSRLDDDEKGVANTDAPGGQQEMTVINESGLYRLILTSRKPEAKRFKI
jgi:anti-repressor protein